MTKQSNAELIATARQLGRHSIVSTPEHAKMLGRLAAALEAADQRAAELAAVVEKVRGVGEKTVELVDILASAPGKSPYRKEADRG